MEHDEAVKKVNELMADARICMLATIENDRIVSRPMAVQSVDFDGDLWFFTHESSSKINEITVNNSANVAFASGNSWVSLSGSAEQVEDRQKAEELWNPLLKAWFPGGLDEPGLTLLKIHAESAEYWDTTSNKLVTLFGTAKAAITGEPAKGGENETISL